MKRLNLEADIRFTGTERQQRNGKNAYPSKSKSYDRNFNRRFDGRNTRRGRVGIGNYEHLCRILKQKSNESNQMQLIQLLPHPRQISIRRQNASYNCITNRITANDRQCRRSLPLPAHRLGRAPRYSLFSGQSTHDQHRHIYDRRAMSQRPNCLQNELNSPALL